MTGIKLCTLWSAQYIRGSKNYQIISLTSIPGRSCPKYHHISRSKELKFTNSRKFNFVGLSPRTASSNPQLPNCGLNPHIYPSHRATNTARVTRPKPSDKYVHCDTRIRLMNYMSVGSTSSIFFTIYRQENSKCNVQITQPNSHP